VCNGSTSALYIHFLDGKRLEMLNDIFKTYEAMKYRQLEKETGDKHEKGVISEAAAQCYLHEYDTEALNSRKV